MDMSGRITSNDVTPKPPPMVGFRARCWTCDATPGGDAWEKTYPGGYTRSEVDAWASQHQCASEIVISPPDRGER